MTRGKQAQAKRLAKLFGPKARIMPRAGIGFYWEVWLEQYIVYIDNCAYDITIFGRSRNGSGRLVRQDMPAGTSFNQIAELAAVMVKGLLS